jgi:hypothetical protein
MLFSKLYQQILLPPTLSKIGLKLVCNVNIVYGKLKSENSQHYAQKTQRSSTFMNSASEQHYIQENRERYGLNNSKPAREYDWLFTRQPTRVLSWLPVNQ